jgi:hypothetical protein
VQTLSFFAGATENVARGQSRQTVAAVALLNFPGTHAVHVSVPIVIVPMKPVSHRHAVTVALPLGEEEDVGHVKQVLFALAPNADEYLFARHDVQFCGPDASLNVPAAHSKHAAPFCPGLLRGQKPALHVHAVMSPLLAGDQEFVKHEVHCKSPSREYLPATHISQFSVVVPPTEYFPGPHEEHASELAALNFPAAQT